ncbi:MAG: hypothetical protein QMC80_09080 [Thermoplasmatales archaeon]|nr:hypothetical protein [Thermoplasmatales archaeon]
MGKGVKKILAITVILLIILGAGIMLLSRKPEDKMRVPEGYHEKITLHADVTMNIIFVGFDENIVQTKTFMEQFPDSYRPTDAGRSWPFGQMFFEYISFNVSYRFYFADDVFAESLFAYANDIAEWGEPTEYLKNYDTESGQNRLDEGEDIQYVNVTAVERWINENRAGYGLKFKDPEYILFLLDSYTKAYMPTDTYHYWKFYEDYSGGEATTNLRAWGGNYNFLWLDVGAAPSYFYEDSAETDPPIWHYDENSWDDFNTHGY